jgi:Zn-dependent M28 family amino/carboxypeptidase
VDRGILLRDLQVLSADAMQGRKAGTVGGARARAYILQRFREMTIQPFGQTYEQKFQFAAPKEKDVYEGVNIVGWIPGKSSERILAITAHYDHIGVRDRVVYNGADDNASGVAALFAVIAYFLKHAPENALVIAAIDAEEQSREGSSTFLKSLDRTKLVMNINLDMVGRDVDNILYAAGTYHYPCLTPVVDSLAKSAPVQLVKGHDVPGNRKFEDWTRDSDHFAFHQAGIPFLYFGVEDEAHHHKPTDDFQNMTYGFFVKAVETILAAIREFDSNLSSIQTAVSGGNCKR